ncbi:MAG: hypothetical protein IME93_06795 [Proteobacteria bacterium]|nr:hypothetical protein [Pseudomonadota bacterium]
MRLPILMMSLLWMLYAYSAFAESGKEPLLGPDAASAGNDLACPKRGRLYIPMQVLAPNVGKASSDRQAYMDARYGKSGWRPAEKAGVDVRGSSLTEASSTPMVVTISTDKPEYNYVGASIILETRLDYSDDGQQLSHRYRYKLLGDYALAKNSVSEVMIPPSAIKGNGALLVVLKRGEAQALTQELVVSSISYERCIQQIYVKDRRTAIRLNRGK